MSIFGMTSRLHLAGLGFVLAILLLGAVAFLVFRKKTPPLEVSCLSIMMALLATPLTWVGYAILLLPIFFRCRWILLLVTSAILLCLPSIIVFYIGGQSDIAQIGAGIIYFIVPVLVLWELIHSIASTYRDRFKIR